MITLLKNKWQVQQEILDYCNRQHNSPCFYYEDETELDQIVRSAYAIDWSQAHTKLGERTYKRYDNSIRANSTSYINFLSKEDNDIFGVEHLWDYYCCESTRTQGNSVDKYFRNQWRKVFPDFNKICADIKWMKKFAHIILQSKPMKYRTPVTA